MQIGDERVVRERQVKMCCSLVNKAQWRNDGTGSLDPVSPK
jgi:hypothetical protein